MDVQFVHPFYHSITVAEDGSKSTARSIQLFKLSSLWIRIFGDALTSKVVPRSPQFPYSSLKQEALQNGTNIA